MKKTLITTAVAFSAAGFAFAQDVAGSQPQSSLPSVPVMMNISSGIPPMMTTGDPAIDGQLRSLQQEMETKIKAIRDEYQQKMKALVGNRKTFIASTTQSVTQDGKLNAMPDAMKALQQEFDAQKKALYDNFTSQRKAMNASSTEDSKRALSQDFETKMKALQQDFDAKRKALVASSTQNFQGVGGMRENTGMRRLEGGPEGDQSGGGRPEEVRGTSTANPQGNAWGFFKRFFGWGR